MQRKREFPISIYKASITLVTNRVTDSTHKQKIYNVIYLTGMK